METLKVRTADIGTIATGLRDQAKDIQERLDELGASAALLLKDWEGEGAEAFDARYNQLRTELATHEEKLRVASRLALALQETYEGADVKLARLFGDA